jgi:hypothetical protein
MATILPSSLDSATLTRRLGELAHGERNAQVEFLLHLDEFDRRRAYADAGYRSLWDYCLSALHLREGAAGRRIGAMRVLRRFPALEPALRDGRLCASTAVLLGQVMTDENLTELVARAAYRTKAEVEEIVVSIRPRPAPLEGIRKLATPPTASVAIASSIAPPQHSPFGGALFEPPHAQAENLPATAAAVEPGAPAPAPVLPAPSPAKVEPIAPDRWSVRVTLDAEAKAELETLKALLSHKIPNGDLAGVLREAIRCGIEKHGKRKGAVAPSRTRSVVRDSGAEAESTNGSAVPASRYIPASVRRAVWKRDGGRCTFEGPDGHRCESRWQLEFDHVDSVALGGASTVDKLRLRCRAHNMLHAEVVFGREHMDLFRRPGLTIAGDG